MMDKMVMVVYNEAVESEVMEVLTDCGLKNYTKIPAAYGKGNASGTHLGSDIWPGRNNILLVGCGKTEAARLLSCIRELRKTLAKEGIKAFSFSLEEST